MAFFKNKWVLLTLLFIGCIIGIKYGCKKDTTPKVAIEKVQLRNIVETVDETGKIFPTTQRSVAIDIGATVQELYVQDGDTVQQGQALAIVQTESTTMIAGKTANPMAGLQKAMSGGQMNPAAIAQALQQTGDENTTPTAPSIKRSTKYTTLFAPMAGIVSDCSAKKGERIMNSTFAKVNSINEWEVRAEIGEVDIVKIKEGNFVNVKIDALTNAALTGTVYRITNNNTNVGGAMLGNVDATTYKVFIKIHKASLDSVVNSSTNYTLRSGMNASVKIETTTKTNITTIPIKAVTTRYENEDANAVTTKKAKSETVVFVYSNGIVKKRIVTTGIQDITNIEISSGLQNGEMVIIEPYEAIEKSLQNDMKVKVVELKDLFKK